MHISPLNDEVDELVDITEIGEPSYKTTKSTHIDLFYERKCDGCTKCCEGWLASVIYEKPMHRGKKCHYVQEGIGCAIYENRPDDPCKGYQCAWKTDHTLPEWFKPNKSNVICMWKTIGDESPINYLYVIECDKTLDSRVLSWLIQNQANYSYMLHGETHFVGTPEFIELINEQKTRV